MKSNVPSPKDDNADLSRISAQSPFRAIRQKLFSEGKLLRYLGYAVGEIALIIVGIFFALQLNNWNEDRKAQAEFDLYIVQLKEDVRTAVKDANSSKVFMENNVAKCEFVTDFLKLPEYNTEDLAAFESGINSLDSYREPQVYVSLLGDLLNGNRNVLGRDKDLAKKALELERGVELWVNNLGHIYNQIDLASNDIHRLRGKGNSTEGVPPVYDLEKLKASDEFFFGSYSITSRKRTML